METKGLCYHSEGAFQEAFECDMLPCLLSTSIQLGPIKIKAAQIFNTHFCDTAVWTLELFHAVAFIGRRLGHKISG
jgi:hypothetical protein